MYLTADGVLLCVTPGLCVYVTDLDGRRRPARRLRGRRQRDRPPTRPARRAGDGRSGDCTCERRLPRRHRQRRPPRVRRAVRPPPTPRSSCPTRSTSMPTATSRRSTATSSIGRGRRHGTRAGVRRPRLPRAQTPAARCASSSSPAAPARPSPSCCRSSPSPKPRLLIDHRSFWAACPFEHSAPTDEASLRGV